MSDELLPLRIVGSHRKSGLNDASGFHRIGGESVRGDVTSLSVDRALPKQGITHIDGPLVHRAARWYAIHGFRGSSTLWKYIQRVRPLPSVAMLRADGHEIRLELANDIVDVPLYLGEYEPAEQAIAYEHLRRGAVFVDVGANRGLYTALALAAGATVTAIEPHPALADELRRRFPEVRIEQVAVADSPGTATLHVFPNSTYMSSIRTTGVNGTQAIDVPVARLDELLADLDVIDLMKVDVEHSEAAALSGASRLFSGHRVRAALVEVLVDHDCIAEMLSSWGYRSRLIAWLGTARRRPVLLPVSVRSGTGGNYLIDYA